MELLRVGAPLACDNEMRHAMDVLLALRERIRPPDLFKAAAAVQILHRVLGTAIAELLDCRGGALRRGDVAAPVVGELVKLFEQRQSPLVLVPLRKVLPPRVHLVQVDAEAVGVQGIGPPIPLAEAGRPTAAAPTPPTVGLLVLAGSLGARIDDKRLVPHGNLSALLLDEVNGILQVRIPDVAPWSGNVAVDLHIHALRRGHPCTAARCAGLWRPAPGFLAGVGRAAAHGTGRWAESEACR
eukprot:CAMPEP_0170282240 /NCGR_PEP_ID=MMETSP0116_2-20130129/41142_1 /TAXON_ID=400756 /ORGANISM="Durinskia baltica, Strain CSIRO CS-38" /LENGTH=240 /DNA_ID=CAMNT_0010533587 /DNA_START=122 /DNA_END=840 /DNA_ORIENTATION=+